MKAKELFYDMMGAEMAGIGIHAQLDIKAHGIKYRDCECRSPGGVWVFFDVEYDCELPKYMSVRGVER